MGVRGGASRRRSLAACALGATLVGLLGGCFVYDAAKPAVLYHNLTDQELVVSIEGTESPIIQNVAPRGGDIEVVMDGCHGTAILVETEEGEPIGRVDEPACAGWSLTINEDHTLTYERD